MGYKANLGSFTGLTVTAATSAAANVVPKRYVLRVGVLDRFLLCVLTWSHSVSVSILLGTAAAYFLGHL